MADRRGSRKTPLSLNNHHYCLLQDLSAPPSTLSMMMVFPNSQGSLILILLHLEKRSRRLPTKTMIIFPMVLILCLIQRGDELFKPGSISLCNCFEDIESACFKDESG
nr:uncharacterized protein LOC112006905 [Quercus suber]